MAERCEFKVHPELLANVIKRQAGTVQKAVLEGVMNAVEAGSTRVDVTVTQTHVYINDDGKGFKDEQEIKSVFATFGLPQTENKTWAQYRIGRGQMFAFGVNKWRTGSFAMAVDINQSIDYVLSTIEPPEQGCKIEIALYQTLNSWEIDSIVREISRYVKYVSIPVVLNGAVVSVKPESKTDWGEETDENAYVKLNSTGARLEVFNLGVLTCDLPKYIHGVAGTVVSKRRLEVNFARNEILQSCPTWTAIKAVIEKSAKRVVVKKTLNPDERLNMIRRLCAGEVDVSEITKSQIFLDVSGNPWSLDSIRNAQFPSWTYAEAGNPDGDRLIQRRLALVLDEEIVNAFGKTPSCIFSESWKGPSGTSSFGDYVKKMPFKSFQRLARSVSGDKGFIFPEKDYTKSEKGWLGVLNAVNYCYDEKNRKLVIGQAQNDAWTNGESFIAFNRDFLAKLPLAQRVKGEARPRIESIVRVLQVLLHEVTHNDDSEATMRHSPEFDREFNARVMGTHNQSGQDLARLVAHAVSYLSCQLKRENERFTSDAEPEPLQTQAPVPVPQPQPEETVVLAALEAVKPETPKLKEIADGLVERTYEQVVEDVLKARAGGMTFRDIEKKFGLKQRHGNNARRICLHCQGHPILQNAEQEKLQ